MINFLKVLLAFVTSTVIMSALNFVAQIVLIFMDLVTRWESSSLLTIVLWIVTGVFASAIMASTAGLFMKREEISYKLIHNPVIIISVAAILFALTLMIQGDFISDPSEFTLLFNNGIVFTAYFAGAGGFSAIARKL